MQSLPPSSPPAIITLSSLRQLLILPLFLLLTSASAQYREQAFQSSSRNPPSTSVFSFDSLNSYDPNSVTNYPPLPPPPVTSQKEKLLTQLLRSYRRYERPTEGTREPTNVRVSIKILAITSVDVINMQYTADMILIQSWNDTRLRWDHLPEFASYSDNVLLTAKRNELWLPDLFFRNGKEGYLYRMTMPNYMIRASPSGQVYYSQKITMNLACEMHLRNFPMDQQDCDMDIGSYGYTIDQLKFIWSEEKALRFADDMQISEFNTPKETVIKVSCVFWYFFIYMQNIIKVI